MPRATTLLRSCSRGTTQRVTTSVGRSTRPLYLHEHHCAGCCIAEGCSTVHLAKFIFLKALRSAVLLIGAVSERCAKAVAGRRGCAVNGNPEVNSITPVEPSNDTGDAPHGDRLVADDLILNTGATRKKKMPRSIACPPRPRVRFRGHMFCGRRGNSGRPFGSREPGRSGRGAFQSFFAITGPKRKVKALFPMVNRSGSHGPRWDEDSAWRSCSVLKSDWTLSPEWSSNSRDYATATGRGARLQHTDWR